MIKSNHFVKLVEEERRNVANNIISAETLILSPEGKVLAKASSRDFFGCSNENLIGNYIQNFIHGKARDGFNKNLEQLIDDGVPKEGNIILYAPGDIKRNIIAKMFKLSDENIIAIFNDITPIENQKKKLKERVKFEHTIFVISRLLLRKSENAINESLKLALELSKASRIYIFENFEDKNGDLCMRQIYEQCAKGISSELDNPELQHLSYKNWSDGWAEILMNDEIIYRNSNTFSNEVRKIMAPQDMESILLIPIWCDKKWFGFVGFDNTNGYREWSQADVKLLRIYSELLGIYFHNLKNEKDIIEKNKELSKINKTMNKLFSIISHDLKNPFRQLMSFSTILENKIQIYNPNEEIKEYLTNIKSTTEETFNLLNNLLEWSTVNRASIKYRPSKINLTKELKEIINSFEIVAKQKNINLSLKIEDHYSFIADKQLISIIMNNLISNAIKFTEMNGNVVILVKKDQNFTEIIVKDDGVGISKERQKKLFKLERNASTLGTKNEKGTGLGLVLCKDFIQKHNGDIWVQSTENGGTEIHFTIPFEN